MADILAGLSWPDLGATAILAIVFFMVVTGRLVPRATVEDLRADIQAMREANRALTDANRDLMELNLRLTVAAETSADALTKLKSAAQIQGGGDDQ